MKRVIVGLMVLIGSSTAAGAQPTNFGERIAPNVFRAKFAAARTASRVAVPGRVVGDLPDARTASTIAVSPRFGSDLAAAVAIASRQGRVTSTRRSLAHNREVGGVRNSYHLSGRAIDVVPRPGVRHADIERALRNAGLNLLESLNEGDHSHFAFGSGPARVSVRRSAPQQREEMTLWRMVTAPQMASR